MNKSEFEKTIQEKMMGTEEMKTFIETTAALTQFLERYVPKEKGETLGEMISEYAEVSALVGQRTMKIAEELAESEDL